MKLFDEFKAFALKGSFIDLAVGVIIGTAFGKVVTSLVSDIIMPPLGWLIGGVDFSHLVINLPQSPLSVDAVTIRYGVFIQTMLDFFIIAFAIFFAIKFMVKLRIKEDKKVAPPAITKQEQLLAEIRDILKKDSEKDR